MLAPPALTLFHVTDADRLEAILEGGLKVGSERRAVGRSWADAAYGEQPVYLSLNGRPDPRRIDAVLLAVDAAGLDLVADLPALCDRGAHIHPSGRGLWWFADETPDDLIPFEDQLSALVRFDDLLGEAAAAAIALTGTCAALVSLAPERIKVVPESWVAGSNSHRVRHGRQPMSHAATESVPAVTSAAAVIVIGRPSDQQGLLPTRSVVAPPPAELSLAAAIPSSHELIVTVLDEANRPWSRDHGDWHWRAVALAGSELLEQSPDADLTLVFLFALLHDTKRENEFRDSEHGSRAADYLRTLIERDIVRLAENRLEKLALALRYHNDPVITDEPTVGVCWDSDRLNLWRVGTQPVPERLCTEAARSPRMIARGRGYHHHGPDWKTLYERYAALESARLAHRGGKAEVTRHDEKSLLRRQFSYEQTDAPGKNRTCARGLGNRL